jgi:phospholipase/carboxylesterase
MPALPMFAVLALACGVASQEPSVPATAPAPPPPAAPGLEHELLLTGGASAGDELPLLIALHGMGSRPERFVRAFDGLDVPARVVLPLAPHPTASGGGSWFEFQRNDPDREAFGARVHEAGDQLVTFVDWAEEHYPTIGDPVVTGFSQGGMLSYALAAGWPEEIGAALPIGGDLALSLVPSKAPDAPPPVTAFHGTADEVVPIEPALAAVEALQARGYPVTLHRYEGVGHAISPPMLADWHAALGQALRTEAGADAAEPDAASGCPPMEDRPLATPSEQRIPVGERTVVVETCPGSGGSTAVRARLEGGSWEWRGDYVYDAPSWDNERVYAFEHAGALAGGEHLLSLSYTTCEFDGCDRVAFLLVEAKGVVSAIAEDTQAHAWGVGDDGSFHYVEKTGYSPGYHIASAAFVYRWNGESFERQRPPVLTAEYASWPCPAGQVQPVRRATRQPSGDPIPVPQGAPIEVLATDPRELGSLFEYRVGDQRFWALNWTQTCAG